MERGLAQLLPQEAPRVLPLLTAYMAEIELFNKTLHLVKVKDRNELIIKHILDSLSPLYILKDLIADIRPSSSVHIADVGSGAGFPGIPLAIALPQCRFTLIERMGKRADFLRNTLSVLHLATVAIEQSRMEAAMPGRFDIIVFRALKPLEPRLVRNLLRLVKPGGVLASYKGRHAKVTEELETLCTPEFRWTLDPIKVPFLEEERHLALIRSAPPQ
ncbi:ribosomal RNA small subunit methyltransferase G [Spirochaetia bacterium]|nr:ribosomal RNA small subunit methyltransferase G [Spirochaetia bacterium]